MKTFQLQRYQPVLKFLGEPEGSTYKKNTLQPRRKKGFVDLRTDFGWKRVMGQPSWKDGMIDLLNTLLDGVFAVTDIVSRNVEQPAQIKDGKRVIFDTYCIDQEGRHYILEMQFKSQSFFLSRAIYYACNAITNQGVKGDKGFQYSPVTSISFTNFSIPECPPDSYYNVINWKFQNSDHPLKGKMLIILVELNKFTKKIDELSSKLDKWLFILKNLGKLEEMPPQLDTPLFRKLFEAAQLAQLNDTEYMLYTIDEKRRQDDISALKHLERLTKEAKEAKEGEQKGREEGRQEGREKGREEAVREVILKLIERGFSDNDAADIACTSLEQVRLIRNSINASLN